MGACMLSFAWISNHHYYMRVMDIIWDTPLFLNPFSKQISRRTSCPTFRKPFWAQPRLFGCKPWPRIRISTLTFGRKDRRISPKKASHTLGLWICFKRKGKKREKENQPIKDWRKAKEKKKKKERKMQKGSLNQTTSEQYAELSKRKEEKQQNFCLKPEGCLKRSPP